MIWGLSRVKGAWKRRARISELELALILLPSPPWWPWKQGETRPPAQGWGHVKPSKMLTIAWHSQCLLTLEPMSVLGAGLSCTRAHIGRNVCPYLRDGGTILRPGVDGPGKCEYSRNGRWDRHRGRAGDAKLSPDCTRGYGPHECRKTGRPSRVKAGARFHSQGTTAAL